MSNTINQDGSITVNIENGITILNLQDTKFYLYYSDAATPLNIQGWYINCHGNGYSSTDKRVQDILTNNEMTSLQSLLSKLFTTVVSE